LRNKKITVILLASVVMIAFAVIVAAASIGHGLTSTSDRDNTDGSSAGADGPELTVRSDLTGGNGPFLVGQPLFLQLSDDRTNDAAFPDVLHIDGANSSEVQVRTFRAEGPSPSWEPVQDVRGVHGVLPGSGDAAVSWGANGTLIMVSFSRAGDFSLEVANATGSDNIGSSCKIDVSVVEAAYLFDMPLLSTGSTGAWPDPLPVGEKMNFTITAPITDLWRTTENWTTFYNWTVAVINPEGMVIGGDLSQYNTGDLRVSLDALNNTSVAMAWENGYNSVFYTNWADEGGTRLTGNAAMTPNGKQLTYGGGVWDAWTRGVWQPDGGGHITFHQAGKYLFVFTLTKNGQVVCPPLVQDVTVH
jgi:hypothetical protein